MKFKLSKIGEFTTQRKDWVTISDDEVYKRCRVQLHRRGVIIRDRIEGLEIKTKKQQVCHSGDYLVAEMDAKVGGYGFVPPELDGAIVSSHYYLFIFDRSIILPEFFNIVSYSGIIQSQIKAEGTTNYAAIRPKDFLSYKIPLPDIEIQREIVEKFLEIEKLSSMARVKVIQLTTYTRQLRQSILLDVIKGKLVPQDPNDESAEKLLERIKVEKERLVKEKRIRKEKLLTPILEDEIPFGLPSGWIWCRLGDVSTIRGGKRVPKGYQLLQSPTSHIYIRVTDMKSGTILDSNLRYIDYEVFEQIKNYTISKNDLYITIAGTIGEVGSVPEEFDGMNLTENAAKISPYLINKDFLQYLLSSPFCRKQFLEKTNQMAQPKLALVRIQSTLIPVPPLVEQARIVEKLDKLMKMCDRQEKNIHEVKGKLDQLNKALLREMFE